MKYTHCFDFSVSQSFDSDVEDFDEALTQWIYSFGSVSELRKALMSSDESTKSILSGIVLSDTYENFASATAGNDE